MKNIICVVTFSVFPSGDANANRLLAYSLSMKDLGYKVIVLTNSNQLYDNNEKHYYKGIEYRSYYKNYKVKLSRIWHRNNIRKIITSCLTSEERQSLFSIVSSYRNFGTHISVYAKKKGVYSIVDVTEWHSHFQFRFGIFNLRYLFHTFKMRYTIKKANNVMCISRYLESYYKKQGCNTVYLPPQVVISDYKNNKNIDPKIVNFFYGGSIFRKDYISVALEGFALLSDEERKRISFTIAGSSIKDIQEQVANFERIQVKMDKSLRILGKITKSELEEKLVSAHFLILMRPVSRYSKAGFPSKVPEALASGVGIVCNLTSDLEEYIVHLSNGIIVKEFSKESFAIAIKEILEMNEEKMLTISQQAKITAKKHFNYSNFNDRISKFLRNLH